MSQIKQHTFVIQVDEPFAIVKSIKDILHRKGYDVKVMSAINCPIDAFMDTLEVVRITYEDYPQGSEIILVPLN